MRLALLPLFWLIFCVPAVAAGPWQHCLERAGQRQNVVLAKDCPALWRDLHAAGAAAMFAPPLDREMTLAQLQFLWQSQQAIRAPETIRRDGLEQLLAGILQPATADAEKTLWQAFLSWLDKLKSGDYEAQYRWLADWLNAITPSRDTVAAMLYAAIMLMVLASLWFILRECYYAGIFAKLPAMRRYALPKRTFPPMPRHDSGITAEEIDALPPQRQIAALLGKVVAALVARGIAPEDATLTYRQLARHIAGHGQQAETAFAGLLQLAEPVLFGVRIPDAAALQTFRRQARLLLENSAA